MIYIDINNRTYFSEPGDGLVPVDDDFENALHYGVSQEGTVVSAWEYKGVSFQLTTGAQ